MSGGDQIALIVTIWCICFALLYITNKLQNRIAKLEQEVKKLAEKNKAP